MKKDKLLGLIIIFGIIIFFTVVILNLKQKPPPYPPDSIQVEKALPTNTDQGKG